MKKKLGLLVALLALVAGMMFTSCERLNELWNDLKDDVMQPAGKWYEYDVEYEVSEGNKIYLECYVIYSDTDYTNSKMTFSYKDDEGNVHENVHKLPAGFTVCFVPVIGRANKPGSDTDAYKALVSQLFGQATGNMYAIKTFEKDQPLGGEDGAMKANLTTWTILGTAMYDSLSDCDIPTPLKNTQSANYHNIEVDGIAGSGFNWKKLVAIAILNKIINE